MGRHSPSEKFFSMRTLKGTSLRKYARDEVKGIRIGLVVRPVRVTKERSNHTHER
jgi:hypothetical protein